MNGYLNKTKELMNNLSESESPSSFILETIVLAAIISNSIIFMAITCVSTLIYIFYLLIFKKYPQSHAIKLFRDNDFFVYSDTIYDIYPSKLVDSLLFAGKDKIKYNFDTFSKLIYIYTYWLVYSAKHHKETRYLHKLIIDFGYNLYNLIRFTDIDSDIQFNNDLINEELFLIKSDKTDTTNLYKLDILCSSIRKETRKLLTEHIRHFQYIQNIQNLKTGNQSELKKSAKKEIEDINAALSKPVELTLSKLRHLTIECENRSNYSHDYSAIGTMFIGDYSSDKPVDFGDTVKTIVFDTCYHPDILVTDGKVVYSEGLDYLVEKTEDKIFIYLVNEDCQVSDKIKKLFNSENHLFVYKNN